MSRYSGASYKGFQNRKEAEEWISAGLNVSAHSGNQQDHPFPLSVIQAAVLSSHTPIVGDLQESDATMHIFSGSTAVGGAHLKESRASSPVVEEPPPVLSDEQQRVVNLALAGKSLFFTGSAGLLQPLPCIFSLMYTR